MPIAQAPPGLCGHYALHQSPALPGLRCRFQMVPFPPLLCSLDNALSAFDAWQVVCGLWYLRLRLCLSLPGVCGVPDWVLGEPAPGASGGHPGPDQGAGLPNSHDGGHCQDRGRLPEHHPHRPAARHCLCWLVRCSLQGTASAPLPPLPMAPLSPSLPRSTALPPSTIHLAPIHSSAAQCKRRG